MLIMLDKYALQIRLCIIQMDIALTEVSLVKCSDTLSGIGSGKNE